MRVSSSPSDLTTYESIHSAYGNERIVAIALQVNALDYTCSMRNFIPYSLAQYYVYPWQFDAGTAPDHVQAQPVLNANWNAAKALLRDGL